MREKPSVKTKRPIIPLWLASRQLNIRFAAEGVLPTDITAEQFVEIIDEENGYEELYSPALLAMLNNVDQAFVRYFNNNPIFFREVFEPWYFDTFAPRIFNDKLPATPPPIEQRSDNGGYAFLLAAVAIIVIAAAYLLVTACPRIGHDISTAFDLQRHTAIDVP